MNHYLPFHDAIYKYVQIISYLYDKYEYFILILCLSVKYENVILVIYLDMYCPNPSTIYKNVYTYIMYLCAYVLQTICM